MIFDTTLRDGEQSPGCSMNLAEKLKIFEVLQSLNVDIVEAGFAIASEGDFEAAGGHFVSKIISQEYGCNARITLGDDDFTFSVDGAKNGFRLVRQ